MTPPNLPNPKPILSGQRVLRFLCIVCGFRHWNIQASRRKGHCGRCHAGPGSQLQSSWLATPSRCLCGRGPSDKYRPRLQQLPRNTRLSCAGQPRRSFDSYPLQPRHLWAWGKLAEFAKNGKPVERPQLHLGEDRQRTRTFVMSMHGRAMGIGRGVVPLLDLAGRKVPLDVGGGPGTYSVLISQAFRTSTGPC